MNVVDPVVGGRGKELKWGVGMTEFTVQLPFSTIPLMKRHETRNPMKRTSLHLRDVRWPVAFAMRRIPYGKVFRALSFLPFDLCGMAALELSKFVVISKLYHVMYAVRSVVI